MIGAVIFLDPGDDGEVTVANGYEAYPGKLNCVSLLSSYGLLGLSHLEAGAQPRTLGPRA